MSALPPACHLESPGYQVVYCSQIDLEPNETLFRNGEDSESGMFIVVEGSVGVYLQVRQPLLHDAPAVGPLAEVGRETVQPSALL